MPRIIVYHTTYGCQTGCCGHAVEVDGDELAESFSFSHPGGEDLKQYVRDLVTEKYGAEHVKDIDWEGCVVSDD